MPDVFLTIDTELRWRHHAAGLPRDAIVARSIEPAGVGVTWQLERLAHFGLKACFFVDPMPATIYGNDAIAPVVERILRAGQEVQLHLHANWARARAGDRGAAHGRFELIDHDAAAQGALIDQATDLLMAAGAPRPVAFRAGSYGADDATLDALAERGFTIDSSHNGAHAPWPSRIALPPGQIAPCRHRGVIEVPVTVIHDTSRRWRNVQICALSTAEMRAALRHAVRHDHAAVTIVSHSFECANRAGTAPNRIHVRRFEALCEMLAANGGDLPTCHFATAPALRLEQADRPLPPAPWRRRRRQLEQAWSTLVAERG